MTIRSGGRPREPRGGRSPQAHPYAPDAYATEYIPEGFEPSRRGSQRGPGRRRGGGADGRAARRCRRASARHVVLVGLEQAQAIVGGTQASR